MSHSHSKTAASRLGIQDLDRYSREHDLICQYVEVHAGTVATLLGPARWSGGRRILLRVELEYMLHSVRGFCDVLITTRKDLLSFRYPHQPADIYKGEHERWVGAQSDGIRDVEGPPESGWRVCELERLLLEVKTRVSSLGEVIRQLRFYKSALEREARQLVTPVLVTPQSLSQLDITTLANAGIGYLELGRTFRLWKKAQETARENGLS